MEYLGKNWEQSTLGVYFSQVINPPPFGSSAKEYAEDNVRNDGGIPIVYKCKLNINNPLFLNSNGWYSSNVCIDKQRNDIKRYLEKSNYDAIIAYDYNEEEMEYRDYIAVIPDVNNIIIIDKIYL